MQNISGTSRSIVHFIVASLVLVGGVLGGVSTVYAFDPPYGCHTYFPGFGPNDGCVMFVNNTQDAIQVAVSHSDEGIKINNWESDPPYSAVAPGEVHPVMVVDNYEFFNNGWAYFHLSARRNGGSPVHLASARWQYVLDFAVAHNHALYNQGVWANTPLTGTVTINGKNYHATIAEGYQTANPSYRPDFTSYIILTLHDIDGEMPNLEDTGSDPDKVNIMSFNLASCGFGCPENNNNRLGALRDNADEFFSDIDVLVLQEAGHKSIGHYDPVNLVDDLCCGPDKQFQDRSEFLNGEPFDDFMSNNGGVIILAKGENSIAGDYNNINSGAFEVTKDVYTGNQSNFIAHPEQELHYVYTQGSDECGSCTKCCTHLDILGPQKGVLKVKYTKTSGSSSSDYYIIASHTAIRDDDGEMDSDGIAIRDNNFRAMERIADDLPNDARVIFAGDLNTLYPGDLVNLKNTLKIVQDSDLKFLDYIDATSNGFNNFYTYTEHGPDQRYHLDWVLPYANGAPKPDMAAYNVSMRHRDVEMASISDHNAVIVELFYEEELTSPSTIFPWNMFLPTITGSPE